VPKTRLDVISKAQAVLGDQFCLVDGICVKGAALARVLSREIGDGDDRSAVIARMARAAGISVSTVNQILNGSVNCPPRNRLAGFARVLGTSVDALINAAERDGCEYIE
jgi:transcriptional regulator with XRE-family HTH domain